jgi:hypothetical protein
VHLFRNPDPFVSDHNLDCVVGVSGHHNYFGSRQGILFRVVNDIVDSLRK